jgi:hypothetical protein
VFSVRAAPRLYNEDSRPAESELRESLEKAVDVGEEKTQCVMWWFLKCSNKLYKCAINPVFNPKPVYESRTPLNT